MIFLFMVHRSWNSWFDICRQFLWIVTSSSLILFKIYYEVINLNGVIDFLILSSKHKTDLQLGWTVVLGAGVLATPGNPQIAQDLSEKYTHLNHSL